MMHCNQVSYQYVRMTKGEKVAGLLNWTVFDYNRSAKRNADFSSAAQKEHEITAEIYHNVVKFNQIKEDYAKGGTCERRDVYFL